MATPSPPPNRNNKTGEQVVAGRAHHAHPHLSISSVQDDDDTDRTTATGLADSSDSSGGAAAAAASAGSANVTCCCCGDTDCAFFLEHRGLERDLDMAARLGQVCMFLFLFFFLFFLSSLFFFFFFFFFFCFLRVFYIWSSRFCSPVYTDLHILGGILFGILALLLESFSFLF